MDKPSDEEVMRLFLEMHEKADALKLVYEDERDTAIRAYRDSVSEDAFSGRSHGTKAENEAARKMNDEITAAARRYTAAVHVLGDSFPYGERAIEILRREKAKL